MLPAEVLPSAKEEKVGLLDLAAPVSGSSPDKFIGDRTVQMFKAEC